MSLVLGLSALVLVACLVLGLWAVVRGPTDFDRVLSAQVMGTVGVALVLVVGPAFAVRGTPGTALVLALLAAVTTLVFARGGLASGARRDLD